MKIQKYFLLIASAMFGLILTATAQAEDLPYDSGSQGEDGALSFASQIGVEIQGAAIAYDSKRDEVVVFGGQKYSWDAAENGYVLKASNETWIWTPKGGWQVKNPGNANNTPTARTMALMCYDEHRKKTILVGGYDAAGNQLTDTWTWDGQSWTQVNGGGVDSNWEFDFNHAAIAYDEKNKEILLIFHASGDFGVYAWDGSQWSLKDYPATYPQDTAKCIAYDAKNKELVLLGASGTWVFDGTDWQKKAPTNSPIEDSSVQNLRGKLAYDPASKKVLFFGGLNQLDYNVPYDHVGNDTWAWDGNDWEKLSPQSSPSPRNSHALVGIKDGVLLVGGIVSGASKYATAETPIYGSTEKWDGEKWNYLGGGIYEFDMSTQEDGVWRFSKISIPKGMVLRFKKNAENTPVCWLATGNVEINGIIDVSGENAWDTASPTLLKRMSPKGGPGGFDGGRGGVTFEESGKYSGMPGVGPGGGNPAIEGNQGNDWVGKDGGFTGSADSTGKTTSVYGNTYLQPLIGGSGGGGGKSSHGKNDGAPGGGGGGAILIASSRDILLNGQILANGGDGALMGDFPSGAGSGGAIRLVADRVTGSGILSAESGIGGLELHASNPKTNPTGRIRIEAYERDLANSKAHSPTPFQAPPMEGSPIKSHGALRVASVSGQNIANPSSGDVNSPDIVFDTAGTVKIVVAGENVPDGTQVRVRVTMWGKAIVSEPIALSGGKAEFELDAPAGEGTIQAYSERSVLYTDDEPQAPASGGGGGGGGFGPSSGGGEA